MQTINTRQSNIEMADKAILATMPEQRKAAIAALIATGEIASAQHATFMSATRLIKLPHFKRHRLPCLAAAAPRPFAGPRIGI